MILPNAMPPLIVAITLRIGITIIYEAALSLGLTDPDVITWGKMIGHSRDFFFDVVDSNFTWISNFNHSISNCSYW